MPTLTHSSRDCIESLSIYLKSILPDSLLTEVKLGHTYQPILLMQTRNTIAAFAFSEIEFENSYNMFYGSFKNYYMQQQGKWDSFDLAFIFCVQADMQNLDEFCSKVETDVYFCRKYVVLLEQSLAASLSRLPFIPLTSVSGQSIRPASAQTFLQQQCKVPAMLAKYIVVQRERSPQGIVEDCISGKFGEPRVLAPVASKQFVQYDRESEPVRLHTITIENFRAYRKPQTFEVGSNVTVLYGPNGFGKTSFFDAIDFAVTGGIGRFESLYEPHFEKMAQHLDSRSEEGAVSIIFERNGVTREIKRSVSNRKHGLLDNNPSDRKSILSELTSGTIPPADRVENFVNLFRATHLFSQEQQELTRGFQQDCQLSPEIVSRMLAFEDYVNAVNKTAKVCETLKDVIKSAEREIRTLSEQIIDESQELERLGQVAVAHANVEALDAEIEVIRTRIIGVGIPVPLQKPDVAMVRGWRASLEARLSESKSRIDRLSSLSKDAIDLQRLNNDLDKSQQQLTLKEQELGSAEEKRLAAETALQLSEQHLAEKKVKYAEAQDYADSLEWIRNNKPVYAQLVAKYQSLNAKLAKDIESLERYHTAEKEAAHELRELQNHSQLTSEILQAKRTEQTTVQSLNESFESWQVNRAQLAAAIKSEQILLRSLDALHNEERELSLRIAEVAEEEARASRLIAGDEKNQSDLKNLLSQLQLHVQTSICPLCGEDHESKDKLVRRIQNQLDTDTTSRTRVELAGVQERARQLAEQFADNKQMQQTATTQLADLKKDRARLGVEIDQFVTSADSLGFALDASGPTVAEQLQTRIELINKDIIGLTSKMQDTVVAEETARIVFENTKGSVAAMETKISDQRSELTRLQEEISRVRSEPRVAQLSLDIDDEQLVKLESINREQTVEFNTNVERAQKETAQKKTEINALRHEITSLKTQVTSIRNHIASLQNTLTQIRARFEGSELPGDASEELLISLIKDESHAQTQISLLTESTTSIEMAIDAATTAAAHAKLLKSIRDKEKAITATKRRLELHQPWLKYFEDISHQLSTHQNEAIANFTSEFGPLTSVIQRRLRSVYGFDNIEITSRESRICVRVKRQGDELRPTDYFSQSQQQTLLLGLFLTACSSQTWSAFSTVFLDDPVTHFDDLNTYALLDLIVGLLESDFGKRQFVISTCDEKLLQLARQKFRQLGERAKFYCFTAIGADGPTIEEIKTL